MTKRQKYLPDFVFGSIDGLVTTFAIVSGVVGASLSATVILILGFANLFADGFSMGASSYLAGKSENDLNHHSVDKKPLASGIVTFIAFVVVGIVPLVAFLFELNSHTFLISSILTGIAFFVVGYIKGVVTETNKWLAAVETLLIGALAAAISYGIGFLLSGLV